MIVGNDVSHWQGQIDWNIYKNNSNFLIAKATDGASYIDAWYGYNRQQARACGMPFGSYHFAEGSDPKVEAKHFCNVIDGDPIRVGEILCLDYEIALADPVPWCKIWLDEVSGHFGGMKPLIYLNQALVKSYDWTPIVNAGYGLWLASYQADGLGYAGEWGSMAMQQTSSTQQVPGISGSVDRDVFFGDAIAFRKYGFQLPPPPTTVSTLSTTASTTASTTITTTFPPTSMTTTLPPTSDNESPIQLIKRFWTWIKSIFATNRNDVKKG